MAGEFSVEIVTPDKKFFEGTAEMVVVRTINGDVGILKNHASYVAPLDIGVLKLKKDGSFKEATVAGGFIQVDKEKTTILTEAAEWADQIDIQRANKAKEEAEAKIKSAHGKEIDLLEIDLKKAINRINTSK
ncbi:ATP synthase F1 subunit epsilon [Tepidibacter aestuarii]|uniref:ATP synthase F1 subunit epsilon n=1 Tax=Tepidibacter aestuarii TaxID=2925782 RepID=UPI0020BE878A|nr:ATP synthase F1 subunit epsilon [Tepidibacter aestuarii]CAH2215003.1 ATP synthase (subunit epsilon, F1 subunit) [Tepidibacter aestuarii]